jgi:hypothetical protein
VQAFWFLSSAHSRDIGHAFFYEKILQVLSFAAAWRSTFHNAVILFYSPQQKAR